MFAEDTDEILKTLKEMEYRKIANEYLTARNERKTFYLESRSASFVSLYLRTSDGGINVEKSQTRFWPIMLVRPVPIVSLVSSQRIVKPNMLRTPC